MVNKLYVLMIDLVNQCRHLVVKNAVYSCVEKIFEEVQYSKKWLKNIFIMRKKDKRNFKIADKSPIGVVDHCCVAGTVHQVCY